MGKRQDIKNNLNKILSGELKITYVPAFRIHLKKNNSLGEYKCKECGLSDHYNNKKLLLEIDHIDGDKHNNKRENLRWLCPNCHSQTKTYRSKNNNKINSKWIHEDKLIESIKKGGTISSMLKRINLQPRGDNYNRVHRLCKKLNLKLDNYGGDPAGLGAYLENK